ncbi:hypothetical protein Q7P37_007437 [Cladosporium fusiforme]
MTENRAEDAITTDIMDKKENESNDGAEAGLVQSREMTPPPLPPRPANLDLLDDRPTTADMGSLRLPKRTSRPQLQSHATTALSTTEIQMHSRADNTGFRPSPTSRDPSQKRSVSRFGRFVNNSETDDSASTRSYAPTLDVPYDNVSMLGDEPSPAWKALNSQLEVDDPLQLDVDFEDPLSERIAYEFEDIEPRAANGSNEMVLLDQWRSKLKHFFILSASGKPVYSRHGDDQLAGHYIGVAQTLISFYQGAEDPLKTFTAGDTRFVMLSKGPLNLVAVSKMGESEAQLRNQLESLYMQILSTLSLPSLEKMFSNRPSTDLRRPLQGTDVLLDGLSDGFTRGSPSTLLSSLECLRLRKSHRRTINDTLLKVRSPDLLYGLIVAAGRLVSVVRPKKHSLHPGDLHLIFNMLFEAGSVKAGGGENWIPLCLPGFNNTGFLYMYVSFLSPSEAAAVASSPTTTDHPPPPSSPHSSANSDDLAIVLISPNKDAFYSLRTMRDSLITSLAQSNLLTALASAMQDGRLRCSTILPGGTPLKHFLYKSRGNVQFTMPSFEPHFAGPVARRKLMTLYAQLHESAHVRNSHLKVLHAVSREATALAWITPVFELYCVAGPGVARQTVSQAANRVVQWIRREEERVFIIGGAVF